jgi:hypothetical protein
MALVMHLPDDSGCNWLIVTARKDACADWVTPEDCLFCLLPRILVSIPKATNASWRCGAHVRSPGGFEQVSTSGEAVPPERVAGRLPASGGAPTRISVHR